MMRDAEKTVGNMIDKLKTAFIGSIDGEGFHFITLFGKRFLQCLF